MTRQFWDSICNGWSHRLHEFANCFFDPAASLQNPKCTPTKANVEPLLLNFFRIPREFSWLISLLLARNKPIELWSFHREGRLLSVVRIQLHLINPPKRLLDPLRYLIQSECGPFSWVRNISTIRNLKRTRGTRKKVTQKWAYTRWTFKNLRETQSWCFLKICLRWSAYLIEHQQDSL